MEIIEIPFDKGGLGNTNGCAKAPDLLIKQKERIKVKINNNNIAESNETIFRTIKELDEGIIIGGDHSITYSSFKAFASRNQKSGIIIFDAHPDCQDDFRPPSHEDFLRVLIEEGHVKTENVLLVGLRKWHKIELEYLIEKNIKFITMEQIFDNGIKNVCESIMEALTSWQCPFYLSIDIDVVDPAFAPGTGYLEAGGLSSRELLYFIGRLRQHKNFKMADLVEINPDKDSNNLTIMLGKQIIAALLN
jgi:formiminoglutamase